MALSCDLLNGEVSSIISLKNDLQDKLALFREQPNTVGLQAECEEVLTQLSEASENFKAEYRFHITELFSKLFYKDPEATFEDVEPEFQENMESFFINNNFQVVYEGNFTTVSSDYFPRFIVAQEGDMSYVNPQCEYPNLQSLGRLTIHTYDKGPHLPKLKFARSIANDSGMVVCESITLPEIEILGHAEINAKSFVAPQLRILGIDLNHRNGPMIDSATIIVHSNLDLPAVIDVGVLRLFAEGHTISLPKLPKLPLGESYFKCRELYLDSLKMGTGAIIIARESTKIYIPELEVINFLVCPKATSITASNLRSVGVLLDIRALETEAQFKESFPKLEALDKEVVTDSEEIKNYLVTCRQKQTIRGSFKIEYQDVVY
ncbi:MAG TPA: hypothetical protein VD999_00225 [Vitreimonas sp.]|nr:hypothetical protein [Vitreimonas sp.]